MGDTLTGMKPYCGIEDITEVDPFFESEADEGVIDTFGNVIVAAGMQDTIGLTLLHTHFQIDNGEVLVQQETRSGLAVSPQEWGRNTRDLRPMIWRYVPDGRLTPLQWHYVEDETESAEILGFFSSTEFLVACRSLKEHWRIGFISKSRLERRLNLSLLEHTLPVERTLVLEPIYGVRDPSSIQTSMYFDKIQAAAGFCDKYTRTYCSSEEQSYCTGASDGHGTKYSRKHVSRSNSYHDRVPPR